MKIRLFGATVGMSTVEAPFRRKEPFVSIR